MWKRAASIGGLIALFASVPAYAQDTAQGPEVDVEVMLGVQGYADPDAVLPVSVVITTPELFVGRLSVGSGGSFTDVSVEVPAASPKRYTLSAPPPGRLRSVSVALWREKADGSEERVVSKTARVQIPRDELLVGLFGVDGIETNVRSAVTRPVEREVVTLPMTPEMFEWESSVLSYVVVGPGAFDALTESQLVSVERWVRAGGRLYGPSGSVGVVADPAGGTPWPGTGAVVTRVGEGEVGGVEPAAVTAEEWGVLLRATPPAGLIRNEAFVDQPFGLVSAASAGREAAVPALPWLLFGIGVFVVLVGPVNFFALRRLDRPELAWITVPVLSAVFVVGFWLVGRSQLQDFTVSSASVVIDADGRSEGFGGLVLQFESGGTHDLVFAEGWDTQPGAAGGAATGKETTAPDGRSSLTFELEDLGVGTGQVGWEPEREDGLVVSLEASSTEATATVTNGSDKGFWAWGLVVNGVGYVGSQVLDAGAAGTLDKVRLSSSRFVYEPVIAEAINRRGFRIEAFGGVQWEIVNALSAFAESRLPGLRRPGVFFFGFVEGSVLPVEVDGRDVDAEGPALYVKQVDLADTALLALGGVQPRLLEVTGAATVEAYYDEIYAWGAKEVFFTYAVPEGAPTVATISPRTRYLEVASAFRWDTNEFEPIEWNTAFDTTPFVSPGGDLVVRAAPAEDTEFFESEIRLSRYTLEWETS